MLIENLLYGVGIDVDVVVLDQVLEPIVIVEDPIFVVVAETIHVLHRWGYTKDRQLWIFFQ